MNGTTIQILIWVAAGVILLLLLQRRRRRKVMRQP
jgi:MYXO-CTERM domain-containing protein